MAAPLRPRPSGPDKRSHRPHIDAVMREIGAIGESVESHPVTHRHEQVGSTAWLRPASPATAVLGATINRAPANPVPPARVPRVVSRMVELHPIPRLVERRFAADAAPDSTVTAPVEGDVDLQAARLRPQPATSTAPGEHWRGRRRWPMFRAGLGIGAVALAATLALFSLQTGPSRPSPPPQGGASRAFQLTSVRTVSSPALSDVSARPTRHTFRAGEPIAFDIAYAHPGQLTTLQVTIASPPAGNSPQEPVFVDSVLLQQADPAGRGETPFLVHARRGAFQPGQHYLVAFTLNGLQVGSTDFDLAAA